MDDHQNQEGKENQSKYLKLILMKKTKMSFINNIYDDEKVSNRYLTKWEYVQRLKNIKSMHMKK